MALATLFVDSDDGVLSITLSRPEAYNALTGTMCEELSAVLNTARRDDSIRSVLLTGAGKAFCAGQDLRELAELRKSAGEDYDVGSLVRSRYNPLIVQMRTLEKPIVAAVNGVAAGAGASLVLCADLRIAVRSATLKFAFVQVGLVPDCAATLTLIQDVGYARAAELCMLGEGLSAADAAAMGLINRVCEEVELSTLARGLAVRLAQAPTKAIGLTKRALNRSWTSPLGEQLEYEALLQSAACGTSDHAEGVAAFLEKRRPRFTGN